jgi:hypothetical protein
MSDSVLSGSCLCGAVTYKVRAPFLRFAHCHCARCRRPRVRAIFNLRRPRKLRMGRWSRIHKAFRPPIGAKLRNYLLHRLRFALASSYSKWPRNGHSCGLARRCARDLASGPNILGLKSSVGLLGERFGDIRRTAAVLAIRCRPTCRSLNRTPHRRR